MLWRLLTLFGIVFTLTSLSASPAVAKSPPYASLPPCEMIDGKQVGACPSENAAVTGSVSGRFGQGARLNGYIEPQLPVCSQHNANYGTWEPSPCYARTYPLSVLGCAYIDITTNTFKEASCAQALYSKSTSSSLFEVGAAAGSMCGSGTDFYTFIWGGPYTQKNTIWLNVGPRSLRCLIDFLGPKPDGLYGPTWVKMAVSINVGRNGPEALGYGTQVSSEFYVPIDGDMRDLGPVAGYEITKSEAGEVTFKNTSIHTRDESMTFKWDFGDGDSSTEQDPTHKYKSPGTYTVKLTAEDESGDEDDAASPVKVEFILIVEIEATPLNPKVGEDTAVTLSVRNPFDQPATDFALITAQGVRLDPEVFLPTEGPTPLPPDTLGPGQTVTFDITLQALRSGKSAIEGGAIGRVGSYNVSDAKTVTLTVPARLEVVLTTSVVRTTKVEDEFTVTATLWNHDIVDIDGIKSEPLGMDPADIVEIVSGPTAEDGSDPRVAPITLAAGTKTTITWVYRAAQKGAATLTGRVSGRDPYTDTLFYTSAKKKIAIEVGALEITDLRLQPGAFHPLGIGTVRGVVQNIGTLDVTAIDFEIEGSPNIEVLELRMDPASAASPQIELMTPGQTREFLIPISMVSDPGGLASYDVDLTLTGTSSLDGADVEIEALASVTGGLDFSEYWTTYLAEFKNALWNDTLEFFEGVNDWGDKSTLGGAVVGSSEGVLGAFQKMGDGLITTGDVIVDTATGGTKLSTQGKAIVQAAREYYHTHTPKEIWEDAKSAGFNITTAGPDMIGKWIQQIDKAQARGDLREVSRLVAEPGTEFALGLVGEFGMEKVMGKIFAKKVAAPWDRELPDFSKPDPPAAVDRDPSLAYAQDGDDLKAMPTGVRISGRMLAKAGITIDEHSWMVRMAKEHGVAFFVRPRPAHAARFAEAGYNAKPMAIKFKSVNEIDAKWLGYEDYADKQGLVVLREPKDPFREMTDAYNRGEISTAEVDEIRKRYAKRKAEWETVHQKIDELNSQNGGQGFEIKRNGETIKTKAVIGEDGLLRFTHNNEPVYSDIDLLHIAKPDGTPIDPDLHREILEAGGWGFDAQHGDTMSTSDFDNWDQAKQFATEYGNEHKRGGDPLVIVQGDATTFGYVESVDMPNQVDSPDLFDPVSGAPLNPDALMSNYELFGKVNVTYEGAQIK